MEIIKVVVIGPESTGKSALCRILAEHYQTDWVPEYARDYLLTNGKEYTYESLDVIAKGQIAEEEKHIETLKQKNKSNLIFIDTDLYVMKIWSEFVFNRCNNQILNGIVHRKYDLYLLCEPDIPWVEDELREYPDVETRLRLYHHYKDSMVQQHVPWVNICGDYENRVNQAIMAVEELLKLKNHR